jgi:hypothetical protein
MRHRTAVVVGTVAAVLGAGFLASVYVEGRRESLQQAPGGVPPQTGIAVEAPNADAKDSPDAPNRDSARLREMSQSFRNSTFLVAIRSAGFYCDDVVGTRETRRYLDRALHRCTRVHRQRTAD